MSAIGSQRERFWEENGFLVFPGFFTDEEVDAVTASSEQAWEELSPDTIVDDLVTGRRCRIDDISQVERDHHFKVNDLFLTDQRLRAVALSERLGLVLENLLDDEPVICNTLNFDKGSQQADHLDTLYMTPESEQGLVATWMALEDASPDSGLLRYYPGSHRIRPYRFSTGSMHTYDPEMQRWSDYMADQVERHGLEEQRFPARKGDLFIWHALLLHGGSKIANPGVTRRSLVTHYWSQTDCENRSLDLRPAEGGWWINREPQSVPGEPVRTDGGGEEEFTDLPVRLLVEPKPSIDGDLRQRMEDLQGAID